MRQLLRVSSAVGLILAVQLLGAAATGEKRDPMTEVDVIQLLQGGVSPTRVGKLARESGIAFEVTAGAERDLRRAGANDQLLQTLRELQPATQKEKREAGKTDNPGTSTGILLIAADAPCKLSVDGDSEGVLAAGAPKHVSVAFGDHLVHAESTEETSVAVDWTGKVETSQQQLLQLRLAEKVAQATTARKTEEAERTKQARAQDFSEIMGKWTRTFTVLGEYIFGPREVNWTYEEEIEVRPEGQHGTTIDGTYVKVLVSCTHDTKFCRNELQKKYIARVVLSHGDAGEYQGTAIAQDGGSQGAVRIRLISPTNLQYNPPSGKPAVLAKAHP